LAVIGSLGMLEIAVCCGHAGEILAVWSGDKVVVRGLSS
jgi:S-adenosylmethionine hydrolase